MTRTERTWHWRLWLVIAPTLAALFAIALIHRPRPQPSAPPAPIAQEARP